MIDAAQGAATDRPHLVPGLFELGPDGPSLLASRCGLCSSYCFPRRSICPRCKTPSMDGILIGKRGRLYSFTVCHAAPRGWKAPYFQAYVELPEGIRVFTLVSSDVEPRPEVLSVGMPMELVVEPVQPGEQTLTYKYRPSPRDA